MESPRPVLLTKAGMASERSEARTASVERPITVMKKDESVILPNVDASADTGGRRAAPARETHALPPPMRRPCPLLSDALQMSDAALAWLGDGTEYLVVGAVGRQGVGKSTVMSILAGRAPFCPVSEYAFAPESLQQAVNSEHGTSTLQMLATPQRLLLLDSPPLLSPSLVDQVAQQERKASADGPLEGQIELQALQQLSFLLTVCHVVLVVQDWFVDPDLVRLLQAAEMLRPAASSSSSSSSEELSAEHRPRLVFVHNRCSLSHFLPHQLARMQEFYLSAFAGSGLEVSSGIGHQAADWPVSGADVTARRDQSANVLLLPEFDVTETGAALDEYEGALRSAPSGHWGAAALVSTLRSEVLRLPQTALSHQQLSEKHWYHYAARMWENVRKSSFFHEYSRLVS